MSAVSRNGAPQRTVRRSTVVRSDLLDYCLRVVILDHSLKVRPKYHVRPATQNSTDTKQTKLSSLSYKHASSISSIAEILSGNGLGREKKPPKFPKDLIKLLENAMKRVIMRQDPAYDDALLRSTFGVFYGYYTTDAFQKSMKDNRKIEDLILMFFSKATGEMQKRLEDTEVKHIVNQHVAKFVRLLLQVIRTHRLANNESELVTRLSEYEAKLMRNSEILALVPVESEHLTKPCEPAPVRLSQMPLARKLQELFDVETDTMQIHIDALEDRCTEEAHLLDIKKQLGFVHTQSGTSLVPLDFDREESYQAWKLSEIKHLTQAIVNITSANPSLAGTANIERSLLAKKEAMCHSRSNSISSDISEISKRTGLTRVSTGADYGPLERMHLFYTPPEPRAYYRTLLADCLKTDLKMKRARDTEELYTIILDDQSNELLAQCRSHWRITDTTHKVTLLDILKDRYVENSISLGQLDECFEELLAGDAIDTLQCSASDLEIYKRALLTLNESLFRDLYAEMQHIYTSRIDTQILTFLEDHIYSNDLFRESAPETAHLLDELEAGIEQAASEAYTTKLKAVYSAQNPEVLYVVALGTDLIKEVEKLQKRYKRLILDVINVWHIYLRVVLRSYLEDLRKLMEECYKSAKTKDMELSVQDMFDLYRVVYDAHGLLKTHCPDFSSPINMDQYFRPTVLKWLMSANNSILDLVPRLIGADTFSASHETASTDLDGSVRSQSVMLLFRAMNQHLNHIRDLQWPDEYWSAKFVTTLTRTFSEALKDYCSRLERLFAEDMAVQSQVPPPSESESTSIQQRLLTKARDAINKKESVEPFHISESACMKLNNIEWSKVHLDMLESSIDTSSLSATIEKYEGQRPMWVPGQSTLFTIKVISAENLAPCDANGFSDPYVVLSDQKGKRVGKTRTIYTNLNPRWDETFDVPTNEPLWLAATVWDRDPGGEHDICGRCYFKLDPRYFEDFRPKEFHVNLDTQGVLHLRITMEGQIDDSSFYFGRAFRFLIRAESDMTRAIVDKMTPFINMSLSRSTLQAIFSKSISLDTTIDSAYTLLNKAGFSSSRTTNSVKPTQLTNQEMEAPIEPLMAYLDNNFRVLDASLNRSAFNMVMSKLWNHILRMLEDIVVPPLLAASEKLQPALKDNELDVVYKWLGFLKDTFAGDGGGLSDEELQTPLYHELLSIRFFYFDEVEELMRECDRMAAHSMIRFEELESRGSLHRNAHNLGTIKQVRDEKRARRRELSNSEDIILRVLRLRKSREAQSFISARLEQKSAESRRAVAEAGMTHQSTVPSRHFNRRVSGIR